VTAPRNFDGADGGNFEAAFGVPPAVLAAAPGRVNLIGEHTDYTGGWVLPAAISLELRVALRYRDDLEVHGVSRETGAAEALLRAGAAGDWLDYPRGVALELAAAGRIPARGFDLQVESDLPSGAGLSSSAALAVATGLALAAAAGGRFRASERPELARICQRAESGFVGVPCGMLDPYAIACGQPGRATLLRCHDLRASTIVVPPGIGIAVLDTGVRRDLRDGRFEARTRECAEALETARAALGRPLDRLEQVNAGDLPALEAALDPVPFRRVRHVVSENERVRRFADALAADDRGALGREMYASHASLRDDYDASWPEADFLVERARGVAGVIGARMTGAGWGGCCLALYEDGTVPEPLSALVAAFAAEFGREPRVWRTQAGPGARLVSPR